MFRSPLSVCTLVLALLAPGLALAGDEIRVDLQEGQDELQLKKDRKACEKLAVASSGFDPDDPPDVGAPPPEEPKRGGFGDALSGAAAGALTGALTGEDAGEAAAAGATDVALAPEKAKLAALEKKYDDAVKECLVARGYTVQ